MLKRFVFLFWVTALLCCEIGHASVPFASDFSEKTRLVSRRPVQPKSEELVIELEEIQQPMNLLAPSIRRASTPQEQVFYDKDLVSKILSYLEYTDQLHLALANHRLFRKISSFSRSDPTAIDQLNRWCLLENQHQSEKFLSLMKEAYTYLYKYKERAHPRLQRQFNRTIESLLHESRIRHPYNLNIGKEDRHVLELMALLRNVPLPQLTLLQRATALYHGYRTDKKTAFIRACGTLLAITGGCIYIIYQSNHYGGEVLSGNCYINILTNASVKYLSDSDPFNARSTIPQPKLRTVLFGESSLWIQLFTSGVAVASSFIYPHHVIRWQDYNLPETRRMDFRHDPLEDKRAQDIDDLLDRTLCGENKHYIPPSHELMIKARKFYTYLNSPAHGRYVSLDNSNVAVLLGDKNIQRTQLLTDLMSLYSWSPIYRLLGGKTLRDDLLRIAHLGDNNFSSSKLNKLRVVLYGDYLVRYLLSSAFYYGMYKTLTSQFMGNLKEVPMLGLPTSDISYGTYMNQYTNLTNCCLTDKFYHNSLCPPLDQSYNTSSFQLANHTIYQPQEWEYMVLNIPLMILLYNVFYFLMG